MPRSEETPAPAEADPPTPDLSAPDLSSADLPATGRREELGLQLIMVSRRYRKEMDAIFADHALSDATSLPLRFLARQDKPMRQKDLAVLLDIEGPTLVRALDRLVQQGFVQRVEDPGDRRAKLVSATHAGRGYLASLGRMLSALRDSLFEGATEAEIEATLRLLDRLEKNISARRKAD